MVTTSQATDLSPLAPPGFQPPERRANQFLSSRPHGPWHFVMAAPASSHHLPGLFLPTVLYLFRYSPHPEVLFLLYLLILPICPQIFRASSQHSISAGPQASLLCKLPPDFSCTCRSGSQEKALPAAPTHKRGDQQLFSLFLHDGAIENEPPETTGLP